ncbi:MAG: hypothetical protein NTZ33_14085 [Bacteroidetes bacterium]|nr:hypothetical protein [Bacteroidota bacterium]
MKVKRISAFLLFILISSRLFCQLNYAKEADFKAFMQSKTLVVLDNQVLSSYNESIQVAVKTLWKITSFEFITHKEFEKQKNNRAYSFLILSDATLEQKGILMRYNILNLVLGGKAKNLNEMTDLGSVPLSCAGEDENNYLYKTGGIIRFMQYFVNYNLSHPNTDFIKMIKRLDGNIAGKELWLLQHEMDADVNSIDKIKAYFKGNVKFVSMEEITTAIAEKTANVVFLHKIGNTIKGSLCWKVLFDAATGEPLYFDMNIIDKKHPDVFSSGDFSKLKTKK